MDERPGEDGPYTAETDVIGGQLVAGNIGRQVRFYLVAKAHPRSFIGVDVLRGIEGQLVISIPSAVDAEEDVTVLELELGADGIIRESIRHFYDESIYDIPSSPREVGTFPVWPPSKSSIMSPADESEESDEDLVQEESLRARQEEYLAQDKARKVVEQKIRESGGIFPEGEYAGNVDGPAPEAFKAFFEAMRKLVNTPRRDKGERVQAFKKLTDQMYADWPQFEMMYPDSSAMDCLGKMGCKICGQRHTVENLKLWRTNQEELYLCRICFQRKSDAHSRPLLVECDLCDKGVLQGDLRRDIERDLVLCVSCYEARTKDEGPPPVDAVCEHCKGLTPPEDLHKHGVLWLCGCCYEDAQKAEGDDDAPAPVGGGEATETEQEG